MKTTHEIPHPIKQLLLEEAARINSKQFIAQDPVQFPRRFSKKQDIEIIALLSSIIAWGNRKMICRDAERIIQMMDSQPFAYIREGAYEAIPDDLNIHRTLFGRHLKWLLRGLKKLYATHHSLDDFAASIRAGSDEMPAWYLIDRLNRLIADFNAGQFCSRCLPSNLKTTALKRINMMLRWLVRDDGIVDLGIWHSIPKEKLYIPLDVHVGNVSRQLGILSRKQNDRKATVELTHACREIVPDDPALMDYALFGIGIETKNGAMKTKKSQ